MVLHLFCQNKETLIKELLDLAQSNELTKTIKTVLIHKSFPYHLCNVSSYVYYLTIYFYHAKLDDNLPK